MVAVECMVVWELMIVWQVALLRSPSVVSRTGSVVRKLMNLIENYATGTLNLFYNVVVKPKIPIHGGLYMRNVPMVVWLLSSLYWRTLGCFTVA